MSKKELTAEWHWKDEWGTGFTKATLSEKDGLLEMSMDDIYNTMQSFAEHYHEVKSKDEREKLKFVEFANADLQARIKELEIEILRDKKKDIERQIDSIADKVSKMRDELNAL